MGKLMIEEDVLHEFCDSLEDAMEAVEDLENDIDEMDGCEELEDSMDDVDEAMEEAVKAFKKLMKKSKIGERKDGRSGERHMGWRQMNGDGSHDGDVNGISGERRRKKRKLRNR